MKSLNISEADGDVRHAYKANDRRLLGLHSGMGLIVPGLVGNPDLSGHEIKIIEGTDTSCGVEEHNLNNKFLLYAKKYNTKMISMSK